MLYLSISLTTKKELYIFIVAFNRTDKIEIKSKKYKL